jgi:hypothetical protein
MGLFADLENNPGALIGFDLLYARLIYERWDLPVILVEILARFPINMIDRLISVFGAYSFGLLLYKLPANFFIANSPPPPNSIFSCRFKGL